MNNDNQILDDELTETAQEQIDKRLFLQIRIYWLMICILVSIPAAYNFLMDKYDGMTLVYKLMPLFFLYTIVIQKKVKYVAWGLLFSGVVTLLSIIGLGVSIYNGFFSENAFAPAISNTLAIAIQAAITAFMIWGVILHVKYKNE